MQELTLFVADNNYNDSYYDCKDIYSVLAMTSLLVIVNTGFYVACIYN